MIQPQCYGPLDVGGMILSEPTLGELDLKSAGFVVAGFAIGAPANRNVSWLRALNDGEVNETKYRAGRAVTLSLTLNNRVGAGTAQALYDQLAPFCSPRYRPTLRWSLAGSPNDWRSLTLVGEGLPLEYGQPKYLPVIASFRSPDTYTFSADEHCQSFEPGAGVEEGRTYDLTFDRSYPDSPPYGSLNIVNAGNAPSHWRATIYGATTSPSISIGDVDLDLDEDGGLVLLDGQTVVIDTLEQTILLNGDPAESRFNHANYLEWEWEQLRLAPGVNQVTFGAQVVSVTTSMLFCWRDSWE